MNPYRTPVSSKKRRRVSSPPSSRFLQGVDTLAEMAATAAGHGNTYKVGKKLINRVRKSIRGKIQEKKEKNSSNTKVSYVKKGGYSGVLAGKIKKPGKRINRKYNNMQQLGISTREEVRFQDDIGTNNESRLIGHTSLPVRATYYNMWRAIIKALALKLGIHIPALTESVSLGATLYILYYENWTTNVVSTANYVINPLTSYTWQSLADAVADWFLSFGSLFSNTADPTRIRWDRIRFVPSALIDGSVVELPFSQLFITVYSKSMLKFQNQSGVYKGTEPKEASTDDVDNVPVECHTYYIKGNQFIHQNRKSSAPIGFSFLGFDQTFNNNVVGSEPVPANQILNCTGKDKIMMDPGQIKTSIISYKKKMLVSQLIRMLVRKVGTGAWIFNDDCYVKSLGHARALHIDRVIGAFSGKVRLMGECELKQVVMVNGTRNTATDQYEKQTN